VGQLALLYALIGAVHLVFRRPLMQVSFDPLLAGALRRRIFLWDVLFYGSFALVVTSSVRIAGVLLVFSYLIVPAALAGLFAARVRSRLLLAWILGAALTAAGLYGSWTLDLPTGPAIVAAFGAATALVALFFGFRKLSFSLFRKILFTAIALAGLLLVAFPKMDMPWLDALEDLAPALQSAFLDEGERATRREALEAIAGARAELARLQALEQDVRWGAQALEAEKLERLRQYLAGRGEISAGDQLVLRHLRGKARERQRYALGLPLVLAGGAALFFLFRKNRKT
jgi:zinc/manganese transport system permease protein